MMPPLLRRLIERLPAERRARLRRMAQPAYMGALRRTQPLSHRYGFDRGQPIDRYYIETFLARWASDFRGRGLEVKSPTYLRRFDSGLTRCDVLDIDPANREATVVADLAAADHVASAQFDCFALTQTLQFIYDWQGALRHAHRILRPGGVLLATVPAVSRLDRTLTETDFWRFTQAACRRTFGEVFGDGDVTVETYGNALTGAGFLMGMAAEDLRREELDLVDPAFPVVVAVRAVRA